MPIGRFLCVAGPLLAALLWLCASWMEPTAPSRPTATKAPSASTTTTKAPSGSTTTALARAGDSGPARSSAPAAAQPSAASTQTAVPDPHLTSAETALANTEAASDGRAQAAQKHGARKQHVQRPRAKTQAPTQQAAYPGYQVQSYHSAYSNSRSPAYTGYRPFF